MMLSNTQLGLDGQQFYLTANYKDLPDILADVEAARIANGLAPAINQSCTLRDSAASMMRSPDPVAADAP